jgi:hypothetical protein
LQYVEKHEFPDLGLTVKIYPDNDCLDPIKDYMEGVERWALGYRCDSIAENRATSEDAFFLALAQSIHPNFPDHLEGSDHAEKIAKKYYAISADVNSGSGFVYLVGLKTDLVKIYGCPEPQKLIEEDAATYRKWANGECVGFIVEDVDGEQVDSCWGFYAASDALEHAKENFPTRDAQYFFDKAEN